MIPCFIINKERLQCKAIVEYLSADTGCVPVIVDNFSSYPPLLEWYATNPCDVIRLTENRGHFVLWRSPEILAKYDQMSQDGYCVTDSDLDLSRVPKDFLSVLRTGLERHPEMIKCGLSLEIEDLPDNETRKEVWNWEKNNWTNEISPGYFRAAVDTTFFFCKYNLMSNHEHHDFSKNIRAGRPYTCRHLPWYMDKSNIPDDERYYLKVIAEADGRFNHYSKRLNALIQ